MVFWSQQSVAELCYEIVTHFFVVKVCLPNNTNFMLQYDNVSLYHFYQGLLLRI